MKFWDSSALLPLLVQEATTPAVVALVARDNSLIVWWATAIECASALARLERDGALDEGGATLAFERLRGLATAWHEIDASDTVRDTAVRLLRVHPLRAADAAQLAAAIVASEQRPASLEFVTLDQRLAAAARKEGFRVLEPGAASG
jgi:predicted nucleic acid-binding protein